MKGSSGMKDSDRVLPYYSNRKHFRKAGQDAGFRENSTAYTTRRATGNAVNRNKTLERAWVSGGILACKFHVAHQASA